MGKKDKNKNCKCTILEQNKQYVYIISKIQDKIAFINSYSKFIEGNIDVLEWMDIMEELIESTCITDEELDYLNCKLKQKVLQENYSIANILREINIINDEKLLPYKKEEKLKRIALENKSITYNYDYKNPKKTIPEDLKEYSNRKWLTSIVTNPVGGKR